MPLDAPDWFSKLDAAPEASEQPSPASVPSDATPSSPPAGMPPNARAPVGPDVPTMVVRPSGTTATDRPSGPPDWFNELAVAPESPSLQSPPTSPTLRPSWSQGPIKIPVGPQQPQQPMSQPIGATEFGAPIFGDDAENAEVRSGQGRILEKAGEGATLGLLPYGIAGARTLAGVPFLQGLQQARDYTAQTSRDYPFASAIAEGAGSVLPPVATFGAAAPAIRAAGGLGRFGGPIAQAMTGAGLGAASAPGQDIGSGQTQNLGRDMTTGAFTGGVLGGLPPILGAIPRAASPEVAQLAQLGRDTYDIPIRPGQISGNRIVRTADSVLKSIPFSGHSGLDEDAQQAVNSAVARTFGENVSKITPDIVNQARTRIGGVLQDVESRNAVNFDQPLVNDLAGIESNARSSLTDPEYGVIQRQLDGVMTNLRATGDITGQTYGNLIHKGAPLDAAANSANSNVATYASQIKDALRRSLQRSLSGDDAAAYSQARTQWKNLRTIEPLTQSADVVGGASPSTGDINPVALRAVVNRSYPNVTQARQGEIPLNDIADIGQQFLKEQKSSQTSERTWLMRTLHGLGHGLTGGGAAAAVMEHGLPSLPAVGAAAGGIAATGALARGAGAVLRSPGLANRMIGNTLGTPVPAGAISAWCQGRDPDRHQSADRYSRVQPRSEPSDRR